MDFVSDVLRGGRRFRILNVLDVLSREGLASEVDTSLPAKRVIGALDEVSEHMGSFLSRSTVSSRCFGSGAFLSAAREGAHFFHASQCSMADGWSGLSVGTGAATFRFTDLKPAPFASAFARAMDELKQH